jgi:hypothetical protein
VPEEYVNMIGYDDTNFFVVGRVNALQEILQTSIIGMREDCQRRRRVVRYFE